MAYASEPRISCVASSTIALVDLASPRARCQRSRRATFSALTTASSITTAMATAMPANEIALKLSPRRSRVSAAAIRDTGTVTSAISTVRHWNRNPATSSARSIPAIASDSVRLSMASSIRPAGRKIDVSVRRPDSAGSSSSSASSIPSVTSGVLAPGNFSTTSSSPSPFPTTALPISGWCPTSMFETSDSCSRPAVSSTGTLPSSRGSAILSKTFRT